MRGPLAPLPRELARLEFLDRPGVPSAELAESLADIGRLNGLGPTRTLLTHVAPFLERFVAERHRRPFRVLDVGTGGADVPVALVRWARERGARVSVVAVDVQPEVLACASPAAQRLGEVRLVAADALRLPTRPAGVDLALCSLTLHHLPEPAVVALLRLMAEVARLGFVVSDLRRSRGAWLAAWLATRLISRNRITRHDGPLSVRRAYTRRELAALSAKAGLSQVQWYRAPFFRVLGVYARAAR
jgi:2-polyprenyl-3-methyl-5-hydroxy-6-metoxy-1,4-benzoquinol methylase